MSITSYVPRFAQIWNRGDTGSSWWHHILRSVPGITLAPSEYLGVFLIVHQLLTTLRRVRRIGPRMWLRGVEVRLFQDLQSDWGWQAWPQNMDGRVSLWVPGQAGLLLDCSYEGLKNWIVGLIPDISTDLSQWAHFWGIACLPRWLFPDHDWEWLAKLQDHFRICSWTKLEGVPQVHRTVCLPQGARWAGTMAEMGWSWAMSHFRVHKWD